MPENPEFASWKSWTTVKLIKMISDAKDENTKAALEELLYRLQPLREIYSASYLTRIYEIAKKYNLPELLEIIDKYSAVKQ